MSARSFPIFAFILVWIGFPFWFLAEFPEYIDFINESIRREIVTLNITSLGLAEFYDSNHPLHANISALVPSNITSPESITKYLGVNDWYMLYFDYNCSGFNDWLDDWDGGLTANCDNPRLYHFNFHDVLIDALPPSVADLASPFEGIGELNVAVWQSWWLAIIGCWLMLLLLLPFTFRGRHRINGITFFLALGMTISIWGSYVSIYCDPNLRRLVTSGWSSMSQAFVFVYCLTVFPLVTVFLLCLMEWKLQRWTHPSDRITINSRPAGASSFSLYPPIDYETEPEILLRPMGGAAFDFQSQQAGVAQNSIRLDVWARARIRDNGFGAGIFEGRDYRIFPRARDGNQGQTTQGQTTQGQTT